MERIQDGGIKVESPLQARMHSVLSAAMLAYEQCKCVPAHVSLNHEPNRQPCPLPVSHTFHSVEKDPMRARLHVYPRSMLSTLTRARRPIAAHAQHATPFVHSQGRPRNLWHPSRETVRRLCRKLNETPFPFPWAQGVTIVLLLFTLTAPFAFAAQTTNAALSAVLTFLTVSVLHTVNEIARDIEDPFHYDPNQLPLAQMQYKLNERLLAVSKTRRPIAFTDDRCLEPPHFMPSGMVRPCSHSARGPLRRGACIACLLRLC